MRNIQQTDLQLIAAQINSEHAAAVEHGSKAITHALNVGELLLQAKRQCAHGQWLPWLRARVSFSDRTAQGYMRLAQRRDIRSSVADMSVRQALEYIATPRKQSFEDDMAALAAEHPTTRKPVDEWTIEDFMACFERIKGFDEFLHKYGICDGTDELLSSVCMVCDTPLTEAELAEATAEMAV